MNPRPIFWFGIICTVAALIVAYAFTAMGGLTFSQSSPMKVTFFVLFLSLCISVILYIRDRIVLAALAMSPGIILALYFCGIFAYNILFPF